MELDGVQVYEPELSMFAGEQSGQHAVFAYSWWRWVVSNVHAITVPVSRLLLAPLRRTRETVPSVVGVQLRLSGLPAAAAMPSVGILNGFGDCARAEMALRSARSSERGKIILTEDMLNERTKKCECWTKKRENDETASSSHN